MFTDARIHQLNEQRLSDSRLNPQLVERVKSLIAIAESRGARLLVTQAFRTVAEQNALYAQGRTKAGKIVTNAKGNQSNHCKGIAVDLAFVVNGEVTWDVDYSRIGTWARSVGLKWGGDWKHFKDKPHVEL